MRFAYADPPYIGQAKKHYNSEEVDHKALIERLNTFDAWALSCSSPSLKVLLPICPDGVRVLAWVKPFVSFKPFVNPTYAWEPVLAFGIPKRKRSEITIRDWHSEVITLQRGLAGAKPLSFCFWLFKVFDLKATDEFYDLFLGTGGVSRAWDLYTKRLQYQKVLL